MTRGRLALVLLCVAIASVRVVGGARTPQGQPPPASPVAAAPSPCGATRAYAGAPIDVDFQGSDLRTTLRLLADTGGINLVLDSSVPATAKVDIKLSQVPWDQVLDVVLRGNQLTCVAEGSVIRVLTRDARTRELDEEAKQRRATEQVPELERIQIRLNYASAAAMKELIKQGRIISDRGTVDVDPRTNTLIVKDVPRNIQDVRDLIRTLDLPEPQVEIEAQIVETDHASARALGIQWGFNGRMNQDLGNTTGLGFPNSAAVGGRTPTQQGPDVGNGRDPRAGALDRSSTAVNLPAGALGTAATSAVGLTMGAINGAFSLDVALSALQRKGQTRILSSPKVVTQNNQEAIMMTGASVPFQTISNNTVVIQFRDAALKLTVQPQITGANTIVMAIVLENGFPDFSQNVNGNPTIVTQQAKTNVLVPDASTVVIGGIKRSSEQAENDQTPGLGSVPLLGWLFRRNESASTDRELLIFITPRILRGLP